MRYLTQRIWSCRAGACKRVRVEFLTNYLLTTPAGLFLAFFLISMLFLFRYSFNKWQPASGMYSAWTLEQYGAVLSNPYYYRVILDTLRISFYITALTLLLGYPVAYLISISKQKSMLILLVALPLVMNVLIRAYGWLVMLSASGLINSTLMALHILREPARLIYTEFSLIAALVTELLPFMVLPIEGVLEKIDVSLKEAAMSLGASPMRTFLSITFPLTVPGVMAGTFLTFALSASAFAFPLLLGGGNIRVMSLEIRQRMSFTLNWPLGAAQAVILMLLIFSLLFFYTRALRRWSGTERTVGL